MNTLVTLTPQQMAVRDPWSVLPPPGQLGRLHRGGKPLAYAHA